MMPASIAGTTEDLARVCLERRFPRELMCASLRVGSVKG